MDVINGILIVITLLIFLGFGIQQVYDTAKSSREDDERYARKAAKKKAKKEKKRLKSITANA